MMKTVFYIALAGLAAICLGPLFWQFLTSLKPAAEITRTDLGLPDTLVPPFTIGLSP